MSETGIAPDEDQTNTEHERVVGYDRSRLRHDADSRNVRGIC